MMDLREQTHARAPWFYLALVPHAGELALLEVLEARHATRARRLAKGDPVVVFDGSGVTARAVLKEVSRHAVRAEITVREEHAHPAPALHLASALPKGDRIATLLSMTTQLGMTSFTPLACQNSVARASGSAFARWERILREACKQSRRPHLPKLGAEASPEAWTQAIGADAATFVLDPSGEPAGSVLASQSLRNAEAIHLLIGPEGGMTAEELDTLVQSGARKLSLGAGILRIETACAAAIATLGLLRSPAAGI
jgi:16S rRNA (uracil1498-N3)-methyltransferase